MIRIRSPLFTPIAAIALAFGFNTAQAATMTATTADIGVIMDESGSMGGEQAFIGGAMSDLDAGLNAAGITGNQFGLVGFGARNPDPLGIDETGRGNTNFMDSTAFDTATSNLLTNGGTEDGYDGIDFYFNNYANRGGAAQNVILVTDEDRDENDSSVTRSSIENLLSRNSALLNAIVNASFECGDGSTALGITSGNRGFQADGMGGFSECAGAAATGTAFGTTLTDYVELALDSGGAAWDLNQLRAGGDTATSFATAFVDVKISEIEEQPVPTPAPATITLLGLALLGMGAGLRRRRG